MRRFRFKLNACMFLFTVKYLSDDVPFGSYAFEMDNKYREQFQEFFSSDAYVDYDVWDAAIAENRNYESYSPDLFIYYLHFLCTTQKGVVQLELHTDNVIWPIHDLFHAKHDFCGRQFSCGPYFEIVRMRQALRAMKRRSLNIDKEYMQSWVEEFNENIFGCSGTYRPSRKSISMSTLTNYKNLQHNINL